MAGLTDARNAPDDIEVGHATWDCELRKHSALQDCRLEHGLQACSFAHAAMVDLQSHGVD